ncbi:MAG: aldehyde dehydrogenase [Burkholderiales bacterium]|nr:aldehyde dehydrogenase [Anaerolineae bacterium]
MPKHQQYIGGEWVDSLGSDWWPVHSPATGELLAEVPLGTSADVDRAVEAAQKARRILAKMTVFERSKLLFAIADAIAQARETIAHDLAQEQGKPYQQEALGEIDAALDMWRDAGEIIKHLNTEVLPSSDPAKRIFTIRQPHGVLGVITPWNFPFTIPTEYLCAGLAAGNTIVWKPSEFTPLSAIHLLRCCERAGLPAGAINLVIGDGATVGHAISSHPGINAIGLTGSPATGDKVARAAGAKPMLLELGGNGPTIIMEDANLDLAIQRTAVGCFANAGQICDSTERILVHEKVHDQVIEGLLAAIKTVRLGPSLDVASTMGPLNNEHTAAKVDRHLADALAKGAEILMGGGRAEGFPTDLYYQPTVIDNVSADMLLNREETFGPVAPVLTFSDMDEAIAMANDNDLGLVAGVFTQSMERAIYMGEQIEAGIVNINEVCTYWQPHTPFGGYSSKRSGVGRLGGKYTIEALSQIKTLVLDTSSSHPL